MADVGDAGDAVGNLADQALPVLLEKAGLLISIFKAVGVAILVYITYLIVHGVLRWRDRRRLKRIENKVNEIDVKLGKLVGRKSNKTREKINKKQKKKILIKK